MAAGVEAVAGDAPGLALLRRSRPEAADRYARVFFCWAQSTPIPREPKPKGNDQQQAQHAGLACFAASRRNCLIQRFALPSPDRRKANASLWSVSSYRTTGQINLTRNLGIIGKDSNLASHCTPFLFSRPVSILRFAIQIVRGKRSTDSRTK